MLFLYINIACFRLEDLQRWRYQQSYMIAETINFEISNAFGIKD